jgi:hypothetical protein
MTQVGIVSILFLTYMVLGGCGRSPSIFGSNDVQTFRVAYQQDDIDNFERTLQFATDLAYQWDANAQLNSVAQVSPCATGGLSNNQDLLIQFFASKPFLIFPRTLWYDISMQVDTKPIAVVSIIVAPQRELEKVTLDFNALDVSYATALKAARDWGGARYEASGGPCFVRVVLLGDQWLIEFMRDEWGVSDEKFKTCIDAHTGKMCTSIPDWWMAN